MLRNSAMKTAYWLGLAVLLVPFIFAQNGTVSNGRPYPGYNLLTTSVFVTPVPNAPFSATVVVESARQLPDGATDRLKTISNIARDYTGRIYNERRSLVPGSFSGMPQLLSAHVYDPETRLNSFLNPATRIARQSTVARAPATVPPESGGEDLGTQMMENVLVHGFRITMTVPANLSGTGKALVITHEYWYSDDLRLNLLIKHSDPRTGDQVMTVTQINRGEPNALIFEVPPDYKIVNETPDNQQ
jgi:hypothetical protein